MQTGRNDPCPCDSGKKYKKCCLPNEQQQPINPARELRQELQEAAEDHVFESLEEAQAFAREFMEKKNSQNLKKFAGLSPEKMHRLLHFPFESSNIVRFQYRVAGPEQCPMLHLFILIAQAIGKSGLKPTATGNLPRAVVQRIAEIYARAWDERYFAYYQDFRGETDFLELNLARLTAVQAGLLRKYKGKIIMAKEARRLLDDNAWAVIFEKLFRAYITRINWAYANALIEEPFFQQSFAFSLYLLSVFGNTPRRSGFYADAFFDAFPMLLDHEPVHEYWKPGQIMKHDYTFSVLNTFAHLFGFIEYRDDNRATLDDEGRLIMTRPFFRDVVAFTGE